MLTNLNKHVLPMLATINLIYKFVYCCDNSYIGRTTQILGSRIKQHVPKYATAFFDSRVLPTQKYVIRRTQRKALASPSSAILKYLLENDNCASNVIKE